MRGVWLAKRRTLTHIVQGVSLYDWGPEHLQIIHTDAVVSKVTRFKDAVRPSVAIAQLPAVQTSVCDAVKVLPLPKLVFVGVARARTLPFSRPQEINQIQILIPCQRVADHYHPA